MQDSAAVQRRAEARDRLWGCSRTAVLTTIAVLLCISLSAAPCTGREMHVCDKGEVCVGTACFVPSKDVEAFHLPCKVCRCVPKTGPYDTHPEGHTPCPMDQLRPKWVFRHNAHFSIMFPTRCNMAFYNGTHLWDLLTQTKGAWIALAGDSLIRSTFASMLALFLPDAPDKYTSFDKDVYHLDHLVCCRTQQDCWGQIRHNETVPFAAMVSEALSEPGVSCITWQWNKYADDDLVKIMSDLASGTRAPDVFAFNPGVHGLVPDRLETEINGMEKVLKACGMLPRTKCIFQNVAFTNYTKADSVQFHHMRTRQFIAAYNAAVYELIRTYQTSYYIDAALLSRSSVIRSTYSGDRLHFLREPVSFGPILAQAILNLHRSSCDPGRCPTIEALP